MAANRTADDRIIWPEEEMIDAACEWWGDEYDPDDCEVQIYDGTSPPCKIVHHLPTGQTSNECGDGGRWNLDGTAYGE